VSINLRTGAPGHGKSYSSVVEIRDALEAGLYVVTNVPLVEGWPLTMARTNPFSRLIPGRCQQKAVQFERRLYQLHDVAELPRIRVPACGRCPGCKKGKGCRREGRCKAVLDEVHRWLNGRTWDADDTGQGLTRAQAITRRKAINDWFSTHRHFGFEIDLITQDESNLDKQVRGLFETHTHLKNLRRFKLFGLIPIVPFNLFVAVTHWHDSDKTRLGVKSYLLNKKLANCYDTFGAARESDDELYRDDLIWLGGEPGQLLDALPPAQDPAELDPPDGEAQDDRETPA
jgi:hypothetical protein